MTIYLDIVVLYLVLEGALKDARWELAKESRRKITYSQS